MSVIPLYASASYARFATDAQITTMCTASALGLLLYDYTLTFHRETEYFWKGQWTFPRIVFLWNRYFAIIALGVNFAIFTTKLLSNSACVRWFAFEGLTGFLVVVVADLIMMMRVYVIFNRSRVVAAFLVFLLIAEAASALTLVVQGLAVSRVPGPPSVEENARYLGLVSGCYPSAYPPIMTAWFFPPLITASILFLMTLYKCVRAFGLRDRSSQPAIMTVFLDHGVVYYVCIIGTLASNAFIWYFAKASIAGVCINLAIAILSVMGSRLLIDLVHVSTRHHQQYQHPLSPTLEKSPQHHGTDMSGMQEVPGGLLTTFYEYTSGGRGQSTSTESSLSRTRHDELACSVALRSSVTNAASSTVGSGTISDGVCKCSSIGVDDSTASRREEDNFV